MGVSADIANFQMSAPFLFLLGGGGGGGAEGEGRGWERSFKPGRSLNFSAVKRDAYSNEAFI